MTPAVITVSPALSPDIINNEVSVFLAVSTIISLAFPILNENLLAVLNRNYRLGTTIASLITSNGNSTFAKVPGNNSVLIVRDGANL
jgi:hypothetical protein